MTSTDLKSYRKPKLGQNFLVDPNAMERIVNALGDISQTTVVEIGPGRAALTDLIAPRAGRLIAVELDRVLAAQLRMKFTPLKNVEILEADILAVDFATVLGAQPGPLRDLRPTGLLRAHVIGNLPYYITSDILLHLFRFHQRIDSILIMVQLEVAERIAAPPGSSDYGILSATTQMYGSVEQLFTLPPSAFSPPPKVHSAVLRIGIAPRFDELHVPEEDFISFLRGIFAMKRKTLINNLRDNYSQQAIRNALAKASLDTSIRAEAMTLEQTAALYRALHEQSV